MDSSTGVVKSINGDKNSFINVVFSFNDESKAEMLNMVQYTLLALIPSVLILKAVKHVSPEEDDSKGSLEISIEILLQMAFMILAIYFTNKAIKYVPTYSGINYVIGGDFTLFLLPFVILLFAMQTKVGAKANILYERLLDLWHGRSDEQQNSVSAGKNVVKTSQPLSGQHYPSQADTIDMSQLLPTNTGATTRMPNEDRMQPQQSPDFNAMHNQSAEPSAANESGGGFSNW